MEHRITTDNTRRIDPTNPNQQFPYTGPGSAGTTTIDIGETKVDCAILEWENPNEYPFYDIIQHPNRTVLTMALAGWELEDISLSRHGDYLHINIQQCSASGSSSDPIVVHRGIKKRGVKRRFQLQPYTVIEDCYFTNGILTVALSHKETQTQLIEVFKGPKKA